MFLLQERVPLAQRQIPAFLAGELPDTGNLGDKHTTLLKRVQRYLQELNQVGGAASSHSHQIIVHIHAKLATSASAASHAMLLQSRTCNSMQDAQS